MAKFFHENPWQSSPLTHRFGGDLVGLAPSNKAPSRPKLKGETLEISGVFVNF